MLQLESNLEDDLLWLLLFSSPLIVQLQLLFSLVRLLKLTPSTLFTLLNSFTLWVKSLLDPVLIVLHCCLWLVLHELSDCCFRILASIVWCCRWFNSSSDSLDELSLYWIVLFLWNKLLPPPPIIFWALPVTWRGKLVLFPFWIGDFDLVEDCLLLSNCWFKDWILEM